MPVSGSSSTWKLIYALVILALLLLLFWLLWVRSPPVSVPPVPVPPTPVPPSPVVCAPDASEQLPVALHSQETSMWCWAASGQMVMHYIGSNVPQCTQANNRFSRTDCPCTQCGASPSPSPPCVTGGWPEFDKYGFTFVRTASTPLTWDQIRHELSQKPGCGKTPVAFAWRWVGDGGHMMVITGFSTVGGTNYVHINDPWAPCLGDTRIITYDEYVSASDHTHWDDFHKIRRP